MMKKFSTNAEFKFGTVWLAGAGPGDPGLLTLHALHALQTADVIVYDALVSEPILELAPQNTLREFAGKRGGKPSYKQADISLRIIQLARQGKRVLRLKGGDPFVFGRGGEEAAALVSAGISFRVVPGVTSGIGGLAYAGIPLTHRDTNQAVTLVTGHDASGNVTSVDWQSISDGSPVIVIYMAIKHIKLIISALRNAGRPAHEPMALVCNASMPNQTVLETTLGTCLTDIETNDIKPPSIIVVGEVVKLRAGLDWLGAESGRILSTDVFPKTSSKRTG
jgi:uroporphyrin-III C-methyltransferase